MKPGDLVRLKYRRRNQPLVGLAIEVNKASVRVLWSNNDITYRLKTSLVVLSTNN